MQTIALLLAMTISGSSLARPVSEKPGFKVPKLTAPVVDRAGLLNSSEEVALSEQIRRIEHRTTAQIAVLTVPSLKGLTIEEASIKVAESWQLGTAASDNGVLILVAKKERRLRIEVGQGLEGALPDVLCHRIIDEILVPAFKDGKHARGLADAIGYLEEVVSVEPGQNPPPNPKSHFWSVLLSPYWLLLLMPNTWLVIGAIFLLLLVAAHILRGLIWGFPNDYDTRGPEVEIVDEDSVWYDEEEARKAAGLSEYEWALRRRTRGSSSRFGSGGYRGGGGGGGYRGGGGRFSGGGASGRW